MINTCFSIIEYAKRCDLVFMRNEASPFVANSEFKNIFDNCKIYCWSTYLPALFNYLNHNNYKNITLLSGDNDHNINPNGSMTLFPAENYVGVYTPCAPSCIKNWYAQNTEIVNNFIKPLPIGLRPPWVEQNVTNIEGIQKYKIDCQRTELIYCNFNISTNPIQRGEILKITQSIFNTKNEYGNSNYYHDLQKYKFVVCPPGNGKDTHRLWESLYFGAIPIVEDSPMNRYYASFFPIMIVEKWTDLNETVLNDKYEQYICKNFDKNLLDVDGWFNYHGIKNDRS